MIENVKKWSEEYCQVCANAKWKKAGVKNFAGCSCHIYLKAFGAAYHPNIFPREIVNGKCIEFRRRG